ncbi:DUF1836 domain-containing protein [Candidatus Stoquefichus sp. SB1]|jgi:DNA-binding transcriptional MerR regulator|uniref:DUF1836 domain-containing protein n=1 Tax=Candidatus Stoquefichus sp. SB1 TaxID=1658109 RepID=UPI00067F225B|nr:DUF1836 domain-containing protein [Candidatus Stoquefichus sp. SB1]
MNNNTFDDILIKVENISDLKAQDIPSLDLYMDQIMTLFDINLADNKRYEDDKLLTKTMINNYSKEGLLKPIKGKKYSKDHILQMLLIYSLKNTISIQEIKKVLQPYHESTEKIEPIYNQFLEDKKELSHCVTTSIQEFIHENNINLDDHDQLTMMILLLCAISNQYKTIAEKLLDTYYQDIEE